MDANVYKDRFDQIASHGFITLDITLGHKLGIFDYFKSSDRAVTATEIAGSLKLKERYVEEWLGSMTAAEIVFIDENKKYFIPKECKEALALGHYASAVPLLAKHFDSVESCFRQDGPSGFDYTERMDFLEWLDEDEKESMGACVDDLLLPTATKHKDGFLQILDLGCGTGRLAIALAKKFPSSRVYAVDMSNEALDKARQIAKDQNCPNVDFVQCSAYELPKEWTNTFDWVVMWDVLHDLSNPRQAIKEINRLLKDDGILTSVDPMVHSEHCENVGDMRAAVLYTLSMFSCLPCSLSSDNGVGHGIGWGAERQEQFLKDIGLKILEKQIIGPRKSSIFFTCGKIV